MNADAIRAATFAFLDERGFRPARWLPKPDVTQQVRPPEEIAARLMALDAVFTWVAFPEAAADSERVRFYVARNRLTEWLTEEEDDMLGTPRAEAHAAHLDAIGWKLENLWPLAWALGFEPEPTIEAALIPDFVSKAIIYDFLPGLNGTVKGLLQKVKPRPVEEVVALEDRFYCAHNAVRSAERGEATVPDGFDPLLHGGAVHERRHALSWCLAPGVEWDDTDLST